MNGKEYIEKCVRTNSPKFKLASIDLLHGAIGCCTEVGELQDTIKKSMFYG